MNDNNNSPNPFSLIADFDGDISELYNREFNDVLPVLPLRNMTFFPGVVAPVIVGRESSMALVKQAVDNGSLIALACQRESEKEAPKIEDLYPIGVVAKIMRILELPNGATSVILQSYGRISLGAATRQRPFLRARVTKLPDVLPEQNDIGHEEAVFAIQNISHPVFLINFICTNLPFPMQEKQELMAESDHKKKTLRLMGILNRECQYASLKLHIQNQTREELDQQQKEYFLQQQIKNIQSELGDAQNSDVKELREKAKDLNFPPKVEETFNKELQKLERLNPQNPDYSVELNYLQTLTNLPWGKQTEDKISIPNAERILNREHYGLEKVKERILEHLALMQYKEGLKTPILCLYGPPGVGKTSLGKSIANALGRKYVRVSLGGVHDEAEVRGHRRTYVGSMPGRIIKGLIKAQTDNPVFVLDEIDKVSDNNYNGDPQSALLEVLDPEQNSAFHDNFLDVDYDLSKVLFVATANSLSTLPRPLLDRMEIISVDGYLTEEKREIARRHLIPRIEEGLGLLGNIKFAPAALEFIIEKYTRESGVRQLEKQLEKIYRKIAFHKAKNGTLPFDGAQLRQKDVEELLGKPLFSRERYQGNGYAGVVTGLAWTAVGGEILFIETSISRSKAPKLTLTGNLGDVMKESAILALEYIKAHAEKLQIDPRVFENWSVHIHVPEGATPKDGPSAGITIATSIASALTQRKVRPHTAMTGEITLRGKVMPVGGIKEKILAAKRAGITDIIMSKENEKDIKEINEKYVHGLTFHFVENVEEVLNIALLQDKVDNAIQFVFEEKHE